MKILALILIDQATKFLVKSTMTPGEDIDLLGGIFSFSYVKNYGAAWNSFSGEALVLVGVPMVIIAICIYMLVKHGRQKHWTFSNSMILLIAGGLGNQIDRIFVGYVTDMFNFHFWPVFNVADIAVVLGSALLFINVLFFEKEKNS